MSTRVTEGRGAAHAAWARHVKERDGYRCVTCGGTNGLEAHHRRPWATFPHLRFDVDNGETLCIECHRRMHPGMRRAGRSTRRWGLLKLFLAWLGFYTVWFWAAPIDWAMRPTRALLVFAALVLVVRIARRSRR